MCSKYNIKYAYLMMVKCGTMFADIRVTTGLKPFIREIIPPITHPDIIGTEIPSSVPIKCHYDKCGKLLAGKIYEAGADPFCNHACYRAYVNDDQFSKECGLDDFHVKLRRISVNEPLPVSGKRPDCIRNIG